MPFVAVGEGLDLPFGDLEKLAREAGPPPWRVCLVGTAALRVVLLCWPPGYATVPHAHPRAEEIFLVVSGRAAFEIGDEPELQAGPGDFVLAKRGFRHAIRVPPGQVLTLLAAVAPNEDSVDETIESN
jgi:mannose-6-phosphate isomerase-like protein (cupin superfamily)